MRGITSSRSQGKTYYSAATSVNRIYIRGRSRQSLEAVVQDHVVLSQIREHINVWFQKHGCAVMKSSQSRCVRGLEELRVANDSVFRDSGVADDDSFCTYYCMVSVKSHIGRYLYSPTTRSINVCIEHLQQLTWASQLSWIDLRAAYVDICRQAEDRVPSRGRQAHSAETAAKRLDDLYDRFASRRAAVAQRRQHQRCRSERHHLRLGKGGKVVLCFSCLF